MNNLREENEALLLDRNELLAHYQRVTAEKLALEAALERLANVADEYRTYPLGVMTDDTHVAFLRTRQELAQAIDAVRASLEKTNVD